MHDDILGELSGAIRNAKETLREKESEITRLHDVIMKLQHENKALREEIKELEEKK